MQRIILNSGNTFSLFLRLGVAGFSLCLSRQVAGSGRAAANGVGDGVSAGILLRAHRLATHASRIGPAGAS